MQPDQLKTHRLGDAEITANVVGEQPPLQNSISGQRPKRFAIHAGEFHAVEILAQGGIGEITCAKPDGWNTAGNRGLAVTASPDCAL